MGEFNKKTVVVTGGGSGIGAGVARAFAKEGARVAILDLNYEAATAVAGELPGAIAILTDVRDSASVDRAFVAIISNFGRVDVLANIAGITGRNDSDQAERQKLQRQEAQEKGRITIGLDTTIRLTDEQWMSMIGVHLNGTFYCCRAALRSMVPQHSGAIINTASVTAIAGWPGLPHYGAAKGGIISFSRSLAKEVIVQGIRVNVIAPGAVDTPMTADLPQEQRRSTMAQIPAGRFATTQDLADAYLFLASEKSAYIVGETLNINGGLLTV